MSRDARNTPRNAPRERWHQRALRSLPGVLRLVLFFVALYVGMTFLAVKQAEAEVEEIMVGIGAEMMRYPGSTQGEARAMHFNGQTVHLMTGTTDHDVETVLDHFEAECMEQDDVAERLRELQAGGQLDATIDVEEVDGVLRRTFGSRGVVACLDPVDGESNGDPESLGERVQQFLRTGDLSEIGALRYLYATPFEEPDGRRGTHLVSIFSDGPLDVFDMFPEEGDAVGVDPDGVPRPDGSRRLLSAWEDGKPYSMTIYAVEGSEPEALDRWYRDALGEAGWAPIETRDGERVRIDGQLIQAVSQGERIVSVVVAPGAEGTPTTATVLTSDREP